MRDTPFIMTAGPTQISEEVKDDLAKVSTNPDLDENTVFDNKRV